VLEREKHKNLSGKHQKTGIENAPGWNDRLASASEAAVKVRAYIPFSGSFPPFPLTMMSLFLIAGRPRRREPVDTAAADGGGSEGAARG
jgi:hypothetical protein